MKLKINDKIPNSKVFVLTKDGPSPSSIEILFQNKKILLVSVPGAFTPTCALDHIPGYIKYIDEFIEKGIDDLYVVAVNDPFVMDAWIKSYNNEKIKYIADASESFMNDSGFSIDLSSIGLGNRLSRFAMVIDNCEIKKIFDEDGGGLEVSKAENVITLI